MLALTQAPSVLWYFARASGFVSLILMAAVVALGIALSLRWRTPHWPTFVTEELHRYVSTVLLVFIAIHVLTLLLDPFAKFSLADMLVPFASTYKTFWMGLGVCGAELTVALGLSVHVRRWIGYRAWRILHYGTYALFPIAVLHGLGTGTDTHSLWAEAIYAVSATVVGIMVFWRGGAGSEGPNRAGSRVVAARAK